VKCDKLLLALSEKEHNDVKEIKVDRNGFYVTQTCFGLLGQTNWWRNLSKLELKVGSDEVILISPKFYEQFLLSIAFLPHLTHSTKFFNGSAPTYSSVARVG
jgi:hypothetical protein